MKITEWYRNKPGAVSVTFDDAGYSQYISALPILDKYLIKGTFSIVGEWVEEEPSWSAEPGNFEIRKMGWQQLVELYDHGHELAVHGYYHRKYDKSLPVNELAIDMKTIKDLIESKIPGKVFTLHYPYSYASENIPLAAKEAGYLFGRTGLDTINSSSPQDMMLLATQVVLNTELPDSARFQNWIGQARGNWLILMYHHFFQTDSKEAGLFKLHDIKYTYSIPPETFEEQMKALVSSGFWIDPECDVGKYITQRENTEVRIIKTKKKIIIYTVTNLDNKIYNMPLTLQVFIPWKRVSVKGSMDDGIFNVNDKMLCIDVIPEKELVITKD